jgi:hypothetical protein
VIWSKFHTEDSRILGVTVQDLVARGGQAPGFCATLCSNYTVCLINYGLGVRFAILLISVISKTGLTLVIGMLPRRGTPHSWRAAYRMSPDRR